MFPSITLNLNITKLFCGLHSMILLLPTAAILEWPLAAILEISVASQKGRGKLCYLINVKLFNLINSTLSRKMSELSFSFLWRHCTPQMITPIWPPLASVFQQQMLDPVLFLTSVMSWDTSTHAPYEVISLHSLVFKNTISANSKSRCMLNRNTTARFPQTFANWLLALGLKVLRNNNSNSV